MEKCLEKASGEHDLRTAPNQKGEQTPISNRIGFHWNRISAIGSKQAASSLGGGLIATTMTPNKEGALPQGHAQKELSRLKTAGHSVSMVVA